MLNECLMIVRITIVGYLVLPYHPVINPNKPWKVRIVFDCASRCIGVFLNDALMQLMNNLMGLLIRFCLENIALVANIEAMFHKVLVEPDDRSALQFLWWPADNVTEDSQVNFRSHYVSKLCPFCLKQVSEIG